MRCAGHAGKRALRHHCMMGVTAPVTEEPAAVLGHDGLRVKPRLPFFHYAAPCQPGTSWKNRTPCPKRVEVGPLVGIGGLVHSGKNYPSFLRGTFCHTLSAEQASWKLGVLRCRAPWKVVITGLRHPGKKCRRALWGVVLTDPYNVLLWPTYSSTLGRGAYLCSCWASWDLSAIGSGHCGVSSTWYEVSSFMPLQSHGSQPGAIVI